MTQIISVSMNEADKEWLNATEISPSKLLQDAIEQRRSSTEKLRQEIKTLLHNSAGLRRELELRCKFIQESNSLTAYETWACTIK